MVEFVLEYWLQFAFGIVITLLSYIGKRIHDYFSLIRTTQNSVKVLLKIHLMEDYHYYLKKGSITMGERECFSLLYQEYRKLGGNGILEDAMTKIEDLSLESDIGGD